MKFPEPVPVSTIAQMIGAELVGSKDAMVTGINEIHRVEEGDLVFVDHPKYYETCLQSAATFIIINKRTEIPPGKTILVVDQPFEAYLKIVEHYRPFRPSMKMLSDSAVIGEGTVVMPGAYIGNNVRIGRNCVIHPNVTILDHCEIGNEVVIQSGTVIGSDAFYYNKKMGRDIHYKRMKSCGRVIIEDSVEIGAGCTIDRGVTHDTRIGKGTKMDNIIHVGHDTIIGANCLIAASVIIAGGVIVEDEVTIWGQAALNKTLTVGKGAVLLGRTGVTQSIPGDKTYWGLPAQEAGVVKREIVWVKRIPVMWEKLMSKK